MSERCGRLINKKKLSAEVAKIWYRNESSVYEIVKREGILASFAVLPETGKVTATVCDKHMNKMQKVLYL